MPAAGRKSSIGRVHLKTYIPYRRDDAYVGRKTGFAVRQVAQRSDGFEPFAEVLSQADKRPVPKLSTKARKMKKVAERSPSPPQEEDEDQNGEQSMELDDSFPNNFGTPLKPRKSFLATQAAGLNTPKRPAPLRASEIDFDEIPSPRPSKTARRSLGDVSNAGSSRLARSVVQSPREDAVDDENVPVPDQLGSPGGFDLPDSYQLQTDHYLEGAPEEPQADEEEETEVPSIKKTDKGKARALTPPVEEEEPRGEREEQEEDFVGAEENKMDQDNDAEIEVAEEVKPKKKAASEKLKKVNKVRSALRNDRSPSPSDGLRRGKRHRYRPLEFWRQEKVVYGKRDEDDGAVLVAPIREIIRIPKEPPAPIFGKKRYGSRKRSATVGRTRSQTIEAGALNPEEGWDAETQEYATVLDFMTGEELDRRIAVTKNNIRMDPVKNREWFYKKVFTDSDFIAAGQLVIPPRSRKPTKLSKDNTYIFYVVEGAVNYKIHDTSLLLTTGAIFLVPRGNSYFIENVSERSSKLFFTQARKTSAEEELADAPSVVRRQSTGSVSQARTKVARPSASEGEEPEPAKKSSKRKAVAR